MNEKLLDLLVSMNCKFFGSQTSRVVLHIIDFYLLGQLLTFQFIFFFLEMGVEPWP